MEFFCFFFRIMRNFIFFIIVILLFSYVIWVGYWVDWGVMCELEDEIILVCGKVIVVKKCCGICCFFSFIIMNFFWYEMKCECCKVSGWRLEVVYCKYGRIEVIVYVDGCLCKNCFGV